MDTTNIPGMLIATLILTAFFTALISFFLLYQYRRSVIRLMSKYAPQTSPPAPKELNAQIDKEENAFPLEFVHINESSEKIDPKAQGLYTKFKQASSQNILIYSLAGLGYAMTMSLAFLISSQIEFHPLIFLTLIWLYLFPIIFVIYLSTIPNKKTRLLIPIGYFFIYLSFIFLVTFPNFSKVPPLLKMLFNFNLSPFILAIAFLNRRTKAVAPLIMSFIFFAVAGSILALAYGISPTAQILAHSNNVIVKIFIFITREIHPNALVPISMALLTLLGLLILGLFGLFLLAWLRRQYVHKKISDKSLLIDSIWLVFVLDNSIRLSTINLWWFLSGFVAFLVFKTITKIGFSIRNKKTARNKIPQLLFLRVFSLGIRSQKLYESITTFWRYGGSTLFITGPDLITSTVQPHDFLDFLSKKLPQRFTDTEEKLNQQIKNIDTIPDSDGLYRIHDFFCYANTWKMALSRLAKESEVVLMDLRSFSAKNAGCIFEINELINAVRLEQVIFLIDKTTDKEYMRQIMTKAWKTMRPSSPNSSSAGKLRLFEYTGQKSVEIQYLLQAITIS